MRPFTMISTRCGRQWNESSPRNNNDFHPARPEPDWNKLKPGQKRKNKTMARKARQTPQAPQQAILDGIQEYVTSLYNDHYEQIAEYAQEAEDKQVKITFSCTLDLSKSAPAINVKIRSSQSVTDERGGTLDVDQGKFVPIMEEAAAAGKDKEEE